MHVDSLCGRSRQMEPEAGTSSSQSESPEKFSVRHFTFRDSVSDDPMTVSVCEVLHPDYGMYTWPCAPVLAQYIYYHRNDFDGKRVLELAAGTALPGIVAAKCGSTVTLTDSAQYPQCLENCRRCLEANGLTNVQVDVCSLTWGTIEPNILELKDLDFVLASDCFYDPKDFEDILMTISFILERNSGCKCLCTYQVRSSDWNIEDLLKTWELQCRHILLSSFDADETDLAGSNLPGRHSIQMLEFTKQS